MLYGFSFGFCTAMLIPHKVMKVQLPQKFEAKFSGCVVFIILRKNSLGPPQMNSPFYRKQVQCVLKDQFVQNCDNQSFH